MKENFLATVEKKQAFKGVQDTANHNRKTGNQLSWNSCPDKLQARD
jgi:hypothetical protein